MFEMHRTFQKDLIAFYIVSSDGLFQEAIRSC